VSPHSAMAASPWLLFTRVPLLLALMKHLVGYLPTDGCFVPETLVLKVDLNHQFQVTN